MPVSLLDANVLLSLAWPNHVHHAAAHRWFGENALAGWATCPLTELAFVRLSMQPAVVKSSMLFGNVMDALALMTAHPSHHFYPLEGGMLQLIPDIRSRIAGHNQLTDAVLLNLAIGHHGRLATFDRKVSALLAPDSPLHESIVTIAA